MVTFKARARTLDMLGRQQIAGIPTAISELFKNAHDAYADAVEVDYYRADGLFVLRDDGLGMTKEEFESRWLTLGTESKVRSMSGLGPTPKDPLKPPRPVLGEKGIGRLAIAAIGPQVLVLTRAKRGDALGEVVAAYINWRLFEIPGVDLDEIEIPVETFHDGTFPAMLEFASMRQVVRQNVDRLSNRIAPAVAKSIIDEIESFGLDPLLLERELGGPSLLEEGHGTHFIIQPADQLLAADIDGEIGEDRAPNLVKFLIGFTNTMATTSTPVIRVKFRDHRTNDTSNELVGPEAFFTPEDMANADHHIFGRFDEYGQFSGTVSVYGEDHADYIVPWTAAKGKATGCGPFTINVGYVQGDNKDSTLPPDDWVAITRKLNKIGGLYIYKDGVRVLPYGNNDYDFLDIERNRTKHAAYYFFSYRRMFGCLEVSQADNPNLSEKAGREGFRENQAYRQLVAILRDFFPQVAADHFRRSGTSAERFFSKRAELNALEKARARRERQVSAKRGSLKDSLDLVLSKIDNGLVQIELDAILAEATLSADHASEATDEAEATRLFIESESQARQSIDRWRDSYRIAKPRGIGLTKQLRRDWDAYQAEFARLDERVFQPAIRTVDEVFSLRVASGSARIDRRKRFDSAIRDAAARARRIALAEGKTAREVSADVQRHVGDLIRKCMLDIDDRVKQMEGDAARTDITSMSDEDVLTRREALLMELEEAVSKYRTVLGSVRDQLLTMIWDPTSDYSDDPAETTEAIEEEVLELRERSDADIELTQLGMAINVINHEFQASIKGIRDNIQALSAWANVNTAMRPIYVGIRQNFEHLDAFLSLFTPLNRRLYRTAIQIVGSDILAFANNLFSDRLREYKVSIRATDAFVRFTVEGYPSTFYPVFVNLVDNSIFWLKDRPEPRTIVFDADSSSMFVSDNGPGIPDRDREDVFELGFTRKPGGRGLGLHISREALRRQGFDLTLESAGAVGGTVFRIGPRRLDVEEDPSQ